jgi:hypothetical protein
MPVVFFNKWIIPVRFGAVEASKSMMNARKREKIYDVKSSR